jgi:2-amino-4-hydroxy-6-hydroxymethyldihydropteridine diphosphokinase
MTTTAYIAMGSNLDHPLDQLNAALTCLSELDNSRLKSVSSWYKNPAIGPGQQPDYLNGVVALSTNLNPEQLLRALQSIELAQGRLRGQRWAARTLDLDIALYGPEVIDLPHLQIPHPRLQERNFVILPLYEIAPELTLPDGTTIAELARDCNKSDIEQLKHSSTAKTINNYHTPG